MAVWVSHCTCGSIPDVCTAVEGTPGSQHEQIDGHCYIIHKRTQDNKNNIKYITKLSNTIITQQFNMITKFAYINLHFELNTRTVVCCRMSAIKKITFINRTYTIFTICIIIRHRVPDVVLVLGTKPTTLVYISICLHTLLSFNDYETDYRLTRMPIR